MTAAVLKQLPEFARAVSVAGGKDRAVRLHVANAGVPKLRRAARQLGVRNVPQFVAVLASGESLLYSGDRRPSLLQSWLQAVFARHWALPEEGVPDSTIQTIVDDVLTGEFDSDESAESEEAGGSESESESESNEEEEREEEGSSGEEEYDDDVRGLRLVFHGLQGASLNSQFAVLRSTIRVNADIDVRVQRDATREADVRIAMHPGNIRFEPSPLRGFAFNDVERFVRMTAARIRRELGSPLEFVVRSSPKIGEETVRTLRMSMHAAGFSTRVVSPPIADIPALLAVFAQTGSAVQYTGLPGDTNAVAQWARAQQSNARARKYLS